MAEIINPHDRFFREVFSRLDLSREFLSQQLPAAIAAALDFATLDLRPGSFLDEELQQYFSDLLFRVNLQTGRPAYVYIFMLSYVSSANANVTTGELKRSLKIAFPPAYRAVVAHENSTTASAHLN